MKLDTKDFEAKMKKTIAAYMENLSTIRAGRATPDVLKKVNVDYYGAPTPIKMSVSGNRGEASEQAFGADLNYDREMSTHDMNCPIDEYTHLWIDGRDTSETHNYIVKAVSKTLNCIRYAIKKVDVS